MQSFHQAYSRHSSQSDLSDTSDLNSASPYGSFQPSALHPMSLALPQAAYAPRPLDPLAFAHASSSAGGAGGYQPQPHFIPTLSPAGSLGHLSDFSHPSDERPSLSPTDFRQASGARRSPEPGASRGPGQRSPALGLPTLGPSGPAQAQATIEASEPLQPQANANPDFAQTFYDPFRIKHRRRTTLGQLKILESHFEVNAKPDVTLRKSLAEQLEMTPREVQVWVSPRGSSSLSSVPRVSSREPPSGGFETNAWA